MALKEPQARQLQAEGLQGLVLVEVVKKQVQEPGLVIMQLVEAQQAQQVQLLMRALQI